MKTFSRAITGAVIILAVGAGGYWMFGRSSAVAPATPPAPPPPDVGVVALHRGDVPITLAYAGRVAGYRTVEVRPQVSGVVLKREFTEGDRVRQGDVLFRIDPRPYQAALDRVTAQLAQARATATQSEENYKRVQELIGRNVATQKQMEDAQAARDQSQAAVQAAEADLATANLNMEYTLIRAPVSGPTMLTSPAEGTLVQAQQTLLTTIWQLDPAYVNFSVTDTEYRAFQSFQAARAKPLSDEDVWVKLQYGDGTTYPINGKVNVSSETVDQRTGTLQIRAIFPNPNGAILPGQFVRVVIGGIVLPNAFIVPAKAVSQGPQGTFVYLVNEKNAAEVKPVKLDREFKDGWIVRDGLNDGDRIIADGVMRVRPGATVRPTVLETKDKNDNAVGQPPPAGGQKQG
jgi:membrane fusion protein (multidrug efflux system)